MGADAWSGWAGRTPEAPLGISPAPVGPPGLDELPEQIVAWAARLGGTGDALLWLVEEDGRRLVVRCGIGRFSASVGRSLRKGEGLAGEVWQAATPLAMTERRPLSRRLREAGGRDGVETALCVPLLAGGSVVGVIGVAWNELGAVVDTAETELLRGFGELAGAAIDNVGRQAAARSELAEQARPKGWLPGAMERYQALSEQIPAVLYSEVDAVGGSFVYKSPQNEDMLGYSSEQAMQPGFWKTLVHPDDRERVLAEDERCERTGDPWDVEYRVFAKDGRVVWLHDHAVLVPGKNGEPNVWQGFYIDVTHQKQAEAAMREALERERQALERERQAARQLRALDEMKNTFLDAVSHELRTPLAAVIGIALTLKRAGSSLTEEDTADLVVRLVANAGKLDRLLTDRAHRREPARQCRAAHHAGYIGVGQGRSPGRVGVAGGRGRRRRGAAGAAGRPVRAVPSGAGSACSLAGSGHRPLAGGPLRAVARRAGVGGGPAWRRLVVPGRAPGPGGAGRCRGRRRHVDACRCPPLRGPTSAGAQYGGSKGDSPPVTACRLAGSGNGGS